MDSYTNDQQNEGHAIDLAGAVRPFSTDGWPEGYIYGATRYADVILRSSFPDRFRDLIHALDMYQPTLKELRTGGGGRTVFTKRFDDSLAALVSKSGETIWGKQNISISKRLSLDGTALRTVRTRGHEIDMFGKGTTTEPIPGIAVEMEWNNKDPFYDRDLNNFQALHQEGAIAIGVIVTRGPTLQSIIGPTIRSKDSGLKFGQSTTHWDKLIPKVNLGGGGECPLLLIGIEPDRIQGVQLARDVKSKLEDIEAQHELERVEKVWNKRGHTYFQWKREMAELRKEALDLMPPLMEVKIQEDDSL